MRWTDLPAELLCRVGDYLDDLKCYASAWGACTAWRRALAPPSPSLLFVLDGDATGCCCPAARRSFALRAIPSGGHCIGSSNGWLALSVRLYGRLSIFSLFHPVTADEIRLPPLIYKSSLVSKLVFTPSPARDDFAAAAIRDIDRLAYVTAGARRWAILDPGRLATGDQLADVVYRGQGTVYCLTRFGDVHVLRLPERRRREPIIIEDPAGPSARPVLRNWRIIQMHWTGPDLNAPATVEPLLACEPFDAATSFAPPYNTLSVSTSVKNLVFCHGNLYQIWRNASCTVTLQLPVGGGHRRVAQDEIFVLRYDPGRRPCWDAVTDLGGYSVFVGRNNAVSMYAEGVPGLKGNSVYWIGGRGRDQGMVFDTATGRSTPSLLWLVSFHKAQCAGTF